MNSAYSEGRRAFFRGILRMDNPYPQKTQDFKDWNAGWLDAGL
jgi:hypothetical protein